MHPTRMATAVLVGLCAASFSSTALAAPDTRTTVSSFFSVTICGAVATNAGVNVGAKIDADLDGEAGVGVDAYGNGLDGDGLAKVAIDGSATASGQVDVRITACFDLVKLAEFLEQQGPSSEAEAAIVQAFQSFDPIELRTKLLKAAHLVGLDPQRLMRLLDKAPAAVDQLSERLSSGNPVDIIRSVDTIEQLAADAPLPAATRQRLSQSYEALTSHLQGALDLVENIASICSDDSLSSDVKMVLGEFCRPLELVDEAQALKDAVLLIPLVKDGVSAANTAIGKVQDTVDDLAVVANAIRTVAVDTWNFLSGAVMTAINGIRGVADSTWSFLVNTVNSGIQGIKSVVDRIKNLVDDVLSALP
ncbi:MAG: hypothetical protein EP329_16460 [Deltaproteobacteria bacterium]|nr:MAG: hypothetical protein EP329_16460 [Deltaproteobacteria bacterium]